MLGNGPFSEFGWKTIAFSPALAGKAGSLFLCLIIINGIIRYKTISGADSGYFLTVANEKTGGFPRKNCRDHALYFCYKRNQRLFHT